MTKQPVLFIGHGSPVNILADNDFTHALQDFGLTMPRPKAILVISAHWLTNVVAVTAGDRPQTIYDFYGFPPQLYNVTYPCAGSPELAQQVQNICSETVKLSTDRGIDHAAWSFLKHMVPSADIPVVEMSLDYAKSPYYHYQLAQELAPLRKEGILIVGSGNIVHNLRQMDFSNPAASPFSWALEFDQWVKNKLLEKDHRSLCDYAELGELATLAVPTNEHYLPLLYAAALQEKDEPLSFLYEGFQNASLSMRCFCIG
jgi:4,5-DOPA dioxygenase extradiol